MDRDPVPVHVRTAAATSDEALTEKRRVDDPEHRFAGEHERQRDRAQRTAAGEVDSAVDRVEDPSAAFRADVAASLLAKERNARRGLGKRGLDHGLDTNVHRGRKIPVALRHHRADVRPPATHDAHAGIDGLLGGQQKCRLPRVMRGARDRIAVGCAEWR